jgi:hypothetical protein
VLGQKQTFDRDLRMPTGSGDIVGHVTRINPGPSIADVVFANN